MFEIASDENVKNNNSEIKKKEICCKTKINKKRIKSRKNLILTLDEILFPYEIIQRVIGNIIQLHFQSDYLNCLFL